MKTRTRFSFRRVYLVCQDLTAAGRDLVVTCVVTFSNNKNPVRLIWASDKGGEVKPSSYPAVLTNGGHFLSMYAIITHRVYEIDNNRC